jgi:hypothetical protein
LPFQPGDGFGNAHHRIGLDKHVVWHDFQGMDRHVAILCHFRRYCFTRSLDGGMSKNAWRDMRDTASEALFMNTYGSPVLQALVGLHRPGAEARPRRVRDEAHEALVRMRLEEIKSRVEEGGNVEALLRIMIHVRESGRSVDERGFRMLRRIGKERREGDQISLDRFREILKEQVFLMELDRERALAALPKLVPTEQSRRAVVKAAQQLLDVHGTPHRDEVARLHQIKLLLDLEKEPATRAKEAGGAPPPAGRLIRPADVTKQGVNP